MSLSIVSAIAVHKLAAALVIASLVTSGGAVAVTTNGHFSNVVGEVSFTVNPSYANVTSLASLNLGTLKSGQTGTQTSTAKVNITDTGLYGIGLVDLGVLHQAFSEFNVTITGAASPITLSLNHPRQSINFSSSGTDVLTISLQYTVRSNGPIERGITVSHAPFLELFSGGLAVPPTHTTTTETTTTSASHT